MPTWLRYLVHGVVIGGVMVLYLLLNLATIPVSPRGWAAALFLGVPLMLCMEALGHWVLGRPFLERWPSWARMAYGVAAMLLVLALTVPLLVVVMQLIES